MLVRLKFSMTNKSLAFFAKTFAVKNYNNTDKKDIKMKKAVSIVTLSVVLFACGGDKEKSVEVIVSENNLEEIRAKRAEIVGKQSIFISQLDQLDAKIAQLDTNKKTPLITSLVIQESVFNHFIELQGNVNTKKMAMLSPEYPGILKTVYVTEGESVIKDQVLAKIDDGNLSPQLAQLQLQAELAKTTYERQERLWNQKIGSEMQYLQAKTNYESQAKVVIQLLEQIEKTIIKAPFNGVIDEIITEQGNMVSPGSSQIMRIVNLSEMHVETNVPERHLKSVSKNKRVEVELPVLGETIHAVISQVGSFINPANRTFKIQVPLANKGNMIKPNLTAKLKINDYTNEKALLIPQSIISENAEGKEYVYIVKSKKGKVGIAKRAFITTGKSDGDNIEVLEGITNGAEIIVEGARSVKEGQEVKVINQK
jgi:membrane fusion protein (multidrug efflux system)